MICHILNLNNGTLSVARDNTGTGGTITYAGGNVIHTFTAAGTSALAIPEAVSASVLVVAGGGGSQYGGGGGAGGLIYYGGETPANGHAQGTSFTIPAGVSPVTVGAGGPGGSGTAAENGGQGGDSVFATSSATLTAIGGGYGGGNDNGGGAGGSGGGASFGGHVGGLGTSGQGNGGGPSDYGGGGGAGVAATGGSGGNGLPYSISGTPTWYAGGGGGINALGGQGGGAHGSTFPYNGQHALAGVANTGGGGGGAWGDAGSDGGSGVVIVSYPYNANVVNPYQANAFNATTLSGTITNLATSTLDAVGSGGQITVASGISGVGGINIASSFEPGGVVVYSAAQAYTGATTISNGATLRVTLPSALPTVTDVQIASGAKLDLAFEGTNTVRTLSIDGVLQERNRVYGSVSRPQALGGTGFLKVTEGAAPKGTMIRVL